MAKRSIPIFLSVLLALAPFSPWQLMVNAAETESPYQVHEVLITWRKSYMSRLDEIKVQMRQNMNDFFGKGTGDQLVEAQSYDNSFTRITIPENIELGKAMKAFRTIPGVASVTPNWPIHALMIPNDPYFEAYQWNMKLIQMPEAWDASLGEGAVVAVADSGIAYEDYGLYKKAPDLGGVTFVQGYDFVGRDSHPNDENGHGTHIAGIIAGTLNNMGVAGIAPKAQLMPLKILDKSGSGTIAGLAESIRWAADHGAQVINMSVGSPEPSPVLTDALSYAYRKGVVLVSAVGNDGGDKMLYPAAERDYVIAVGAVGMDGLRAPYSNTGEAIDMLAPGGDFTADYNHDTYPDGILQQTFATRGAYTDVRSFSYRFMQGTSVAAPHVTGVAALLMSLGVHDPALVRSILRTSATDIGAEGWDRETGAGLLNAAKAVLAARAQNSLVNVTNSTIARSTETPSEESAPHTNEEIANQPTLTVLKLTLTALNQFGRTATKFTWWEPVVLQARVVDQDGKPVADAELTVTYKQGSKEPSSLNGKTNTDGSIAFTIGPFTRRSVIQVGGIAEKEGVKSALATLQFSIK